MNKNPYAPQAPAHAPVPGTPSDQQQQIAVDGFKQVLEMLRIADPEFRESLLRRLGQRDRELARSLREELASL